MKKKEILLDYLKNQKKEQFVSSSDLAKILGVTNRSIRYYVKQLNDDRPDLVESSREGYRYNWQYFELPKVDESVDGRRFSILRYLLQKGDEGVDLFDLAEKLWVSESTIRQDMSALQELMQDYQLRIRQHEFHYYLTGTQEAKRLLIMTLIRKKNGDASSLEDEMQQFLGEIPLSVLTDFCQQVFDEFNFHVNQYFFQNFILHLIIVLNQKWQDESKVFSSPSLPMIEKIAVLIFEKYHLELAQEDKFELALLCDGERGHREVEVSNYVSKNVSDSLHQALEELSSVFLIDFTDQQFLNRLLLHTQNLYNRVKDKKVKRNLSALEIKMRYPALFDVAVYLSSLIATDLKIEIAEDEIAFLALHIGSFLDEQKKNEEKIHTLLVGSDYLERENQIQFLLESRFGDELLFVSTDEIKNTDRIEFIISSEKKFFNGDAEVVFIQEFLRERDFARIRRGIERIKQKRYLHFLEEFLPKLIQKEACIALEEVESKEEVFSFIGQWFFEKGFTDYHYTQRLFEREKMASTAFTSGVALPHTIRYEGKKTGFLVLKPVQPLYWDEQSIKLILAMAINPADSHDFNRIFPRIIETLVEEYHVNFLRRSQTSEEFIKRLIELMVADGYYD